MHKVEVRRSRCLKDTMGVFAGKGHAVWRQPLKVSFIGEAGMDSGGVSREWFSEIAKAIASNSHGLLYPVGAPSCIRPRTFVLFSSVCCSLLMWSLFACH